MVLNFEFTFIFLKELCIIPLLEYLQYPDNFILTISSLTHKPRCNSTLRRDTGIMFNTNWYICERKMFC